MLGGVLRRFVGLLAVLFGSSGHGYPSRGRRRVERAPPRAALSISRARGPHQQWVRAELSKGQGIIKVAKAVGVGNGTVQRIKQEMARGGPSA